MRRRVLGVLVLSLALVGAAPRPAEPPGPDLAQLIPFANAPLDKPAVKVELALPPAPVEMPPLPLVSVMPPAAAKPVAFIEAPRTLPCVGAWLGIPKESLECGRARFQRGEYEDAAKAGLDSTSRPEALVDRAEALLAAGLTAEARRVLAPALELLRNCNRHVPELAVLSARCALRDGDPAPALRLGGSDVEFMLAAGELDAVAAHRFRGPVQTRALGWLAQARRSDRRGALAAGRMARPARERMRARPQDAGAGRGGRGALRRRLPRRRARAGRGGIRRARDHRADARPRTPAACL